MLGVLLAGCSGAPQVHVINAAPTGAIFARRAAVRVRIPSTPATLDGDRILVRAAGSGLALLPGVALSERLPEAVAASVTETLRNAHIRASGERQSADVDYDLRLEIRDFAFDAKKQTVKVTIAVRIVALASGQAVASRTFSASGPVNAFDAMVIAAALDRAFRQVLIALPPFVAAAIS